MAVGEMPNWVTSWRSISRQNRSGFGWSGAPSYITIVPPNVWVPMSVHGPIIQPTSDTQKKRSDGWRSKPKYTSLAACNWAPAWVWTMPFGRPVVPEEYSSIDSSEASSCFVS